MSHVFHQLFYHFTWATHSREPLIDRLWRPQLLEILKDEVKTRGGFPLRQTPCLITRIYFAGYHRRFS
jgi:hypothetical protein